MKNGTACSVDGCDRMAGRRELCRGHSQRVRLTGSVGSPTFAPVRKWDVGATCAVPICARPIAAKGLCKPHFYRQHETGRLDPDVPLRPAPSPGRVCSVSGCNRPTPASERCKVHYAKHQRDLAQASPEQLDRLRASWRSAKAAAYKKDPASARARTTAWKAAHPLRTKIFDAKKRQRRRTAKTVRFTADQLLGKIQYWGGICWMCSAPWEAIDHVKPISKGGWHALMNLRPICRSCNSRKRDRWPLAALPSHL